MAFAIKLLACADETELDEEIIKAAMERTLMYSENCDPTIYYITTPTVLGYWLIQDEDVGYESVNGTEYAPVESMY